ncbi:MAG: SOS response-associated peptidase [Gemmatimonadales bacterium]|nr:SOS response-associated peptidase [Gemmatimonadales bacterium]
MCGRYSLGKPGEIDARRLGVVALPPLVPRWNIAPGSDVAVLRAAGAGREVAMLRWGLVPSWAKDPSIGDRLANARVETAHEKPSFRSAWKARRCLVLADAYYEWQVVPGQRAKQPWAIARADGDVLAFGALWESWRGPDGAPLETCAILTMDAQDAVAHIHARMPVIVEETEWPRWLAPGPQPPAPGPQPPALASWPVSTFVNAPTHDDARCLEPLKES